MDTSTGTGAQQGLGLGLDMKQHRHSILQGFHELFASEYPGIRDLVSPCYMDTVNTSTSLADAESITVLVPSLSDTLGTPPDESTSGENSLLKDHAEHIFNIPTLAFAGDLGQHVGCEAQVFGSGHDIDFNIDEGRIALGRMRASIGGCGGGLG